MKIANLLQPWPELEAIRDRLLVVDADAKVMGRDRLTMLLYTARTALPLHTDRLLPLAGAAAFAGVDEDEFIQIAADHNLAPVKRTGRNIYYRVGDVERMLRGLESER
jgi:hypothetical protein